MAITQNSFRQYVLSANVSVTFDDFDSAILTTETQNMLVLPSNVIVTGGIAIVVTLWDDAGSADTYTSDIGTLLPLDIDEHLNGGDAETIGATDLLNAGLLKTAAPTITFTAISSSTNAMTTGATTVVLEYIVVGRSNDQNG